MSRKHWSREQLVKFGLPVVLISGVMTAISFGWNPQKLLLSKNYYSNTNIFPKSGIVKSIVDGDTFVLENGAEVRLLGINSPGRGEVGYASASSSLTSFIEKKKVFLEYDRYQDDKYGRILAWVWIGCESIPEFLPADYMHFSGNASRDGLMNNPKECANGELINEKLVISGNAVPVVYADRGALKYEKRLHK